MEVSIKENHGLIKTSLPPEIFLQVVVDIDVSDIGEKSNLNNTNLADSQKDNANQGPIIANVFPSGILIMESYAWIYPTFPKILYDCTSPILRLPCPT